MCSGLYDPCSVVVHLRDFVLKGWPNVLPHSLWDPYESFHLKWSRSRAGTVAKLSKSESDHAQTSTKLERLTWNDSYIYSYIVEARPVDTSPLWTSNHYGHFLPGSFVFLCFPYILQLRQRFLWPVTTPSFTRLDTSLLWTLFVRPSDVHIAEVLLYMINLIRLLMTMCTNGQTWANVA